jgi:hypothetical protein
MNEALGSILPSMTLLGFAAALSVWLTASRAEGAGAFTERRRVQLQVTFVLCAQIAHFTEELIAGFHLRLPELLRLEPWPLEFFVGFNLLWIAVWVLSILALGKGIHLALFPIWFLAIASALNGIAHPALALIDGAYFPGLLTSPVSGIAGVLLLRRLTEFTERRTGLQPT